MLPTFLGIGVPRAGTTWLYELLASHPNNKITKVLNDGKDTLFIPSSGTKIEITESLNVPHPFALENLSIHSDSRDLKGIFTLE